MKRDERLELCELSRKVYGKPYAWQKMVNRGEVAKLKRTLEDGTEQEYKGISYSTLEEVKTIMAEIWAEELERIEKAKENPETVEEVKVIGEGT